MQTPVACSADHPGRTNQAGSQDAAPSDSTVAAGAAPTHQETGVECRMIRACELPDHFAIPTTWHERGYGRVIRRTDNHIEANIVGTVFRFRLSDRIVIVGGNQ